MIDPRVLRGATVVAAVLAALVWGIIARSAWRFLRTRRPRSPETDEQCAYVRAWLAAP